MFFEEIEEGSRFKAKGPKTITGTEIDFIAQLAGLDLPGFLDAEHAKSWGFKDRVTPGPYILACMFGLMAKQGFLSDALWMGADGISFKTPVFPCDRITAETEVLGKKESKRGGGPVTYKWWVKNQDDKVIAEGTNT
jgi:acyl dehydratase